MRLVTTKIQTHEKDMHFDAQSRQRLVYFSTALKLSEQRIFAKTITVFA